MPKLNKGASKRFESAGFSAVNKPNFEAPRLPSDLDSLNYKLLSQLMSKYGGWREYSEDLLIRETASLAQMQEEYDNAYARKMHVTEGKVVSDKKMTVLADVDIARMSVALTDQKSFVEMVSSKVDSFTNCLNLISREISRRGQE